MLSMYEGTMASIAEGEIVKSTVLRVTENAVILDVGFKSEGSVALDEFKEAARPSATKSRSSSSTSRTRRARSSSPRRRPTSCGSGRRSGWRTRTDEPVEGTLVKKIKGGVVVNLMGVDAFLPGSQIALRRVPNIDELLGQTYEFKIIKLNKRRRNIVVSAAASSSRTSGRTSAST